ncbi:hypothetical protein [uncultured Tateyamaria sp.]|uniref:hypothetical protein n=1 Tax=uncultured Tateyamaria sp. TaxID=455651 RepID=UPI00262D9245|nr:hypothetical protein [uncultured Tateyamaria sp.]
MSRSEPHLQVQDDIAHAGHQIADGIKDTASRTADSVKSDAAAHVSKVADATEAARDALPENHIADPMLDHAISALGHVADHLKSSDIEALARQAGDFTRRNPALVLGGAALLGFAAARFLKAGARPDDVAGAHDPWANHLEQS